MSLVSIVSKAVECVVNGGALLPKEWTMRTRLGSISAAAALAAGAINISPRDNQTRSLMAIDFVVITGKNAAN
jgi:hypothetical protein